MDRQLLLALVIAALVGESGCNRSNESSQAAAVAHQEQAAPKPSVEYRTKTRFDFKDDVVEGNLIKPNGSDFDQPRPAAPAPVAAAIVSPATADAARPEAAAAEAEAMQRRFQAEEQRRRVLAEVQERVSVMGALRA